MKIGFYCYSPASSNSFKAMVNEKREGFHLHVFFKSKSAEDFFFSDCRKEDFPYVTFHEDEEDFLKGIELVFYGTGSGHDAELTFPRTCRKSHPTIQTVAIHDIFWDSEEGLKRRYACAPHYLILFTEKEKELVLKHINMDPERILLFGNPYFDRLKEMDIQTTRPKRSVSFISQCGLGGTYDEPTSEPCQQAIKELLELQKEGVISELIIYKHPRENLSFYHTLGIKPSDTNDFNHMMESDYVISNGSTPHYEAILLGKNSLFVPQENLKERLLRGGKDSVDFDFKGNSKETIYNWLKNKSM